MAIYEHRMGQLPNAKTIAELRAMVEDLSPDHNVGERMDRYYRKQATTMFTILNELVSELEAIRGCDAHEDCRRQRRLAMACQLEKEDRGCLREKG